MGYREGAISLHGPTGAAAPAGSGDRRRALENDHGLLWVLMITSAGNRGWPGDVDLRVSGATGLRAPSVIRTAKIATIEATEAETIGTLPTRARLEVAALLGKLCGHVRD